MDVALIQWPSEEKRRSELTSRRQPRLLLVDPEAEPPVSTDVLEEWVRLPVSAADTKARVRGLVARIERSGEQTPVLFGDGVLEYRSNRIYLSPLQARAAAPLIERFGAVVGRQDLAGRAWPDEEPSTNTLDVTIGRLRRVVESAGLHIRTVRSRGYLLEARDE